MWFCMPHPRLRMTGDMYCCAARNLRNLETCETLKPCSCQLPKSTGSQTVTARYFRNLPAVAGSAYHVPATRSAPLRRDFYVSKEFEGSGVGTRAFARRLGQDTSGHPLDHPPDFGDHIAYRAIWPDVTWHLRQQRGAA